MKNKVLILFIILILGCSVHQKDALESFNSRANSFILKDFDSYDLNPLDAVERCMFGKYIANDLDSLNNWKSTWIKGCDVRNYYINRLELDFSIVKDLSENFFLVSLPHLNEYIYDIDSHYADRDSVYLLKDSAIAKLQSPLLTSLLEHGDLCKDCASSNKIEVVGRLIHEIFPDAFRHEMPISEFEKGLQFRIKSKDLDSANYNYIAQVVGIQQSNDSDLLRSEICYLPWVGHLIFIIRSNNVNVTCEVFLMPLNKRRARAARTDDPLKYVDCFK